ncbi:MAG: head-tail adaptor protein [Gammaproteobacteria bacterium]|nr:head-tail adaptor protein [Gammaproteobacteria bacterium]
MPKCVKLRKTRRSLCSGDLNLLIEIQTREFLPPAPGSNIGQEVFTTLKRVWSFAMTVKGTSRFSQVNIHDSATHLWYVRYDPDIEFIEVNNNFILYDDRRFDIIEVTNDGEDRNILIIQASETGDSTKEASDA